MAENCLSSEAAARRKDVSMAVWQPDRGMAEVVVKKGQMWGSTGITRHGKLLCHVEEAVFLVDRGSLLLMDGEEVMPAARIYNLVTDSNGCSWGAYQSYAYLKKLGYVVGRHGVTYSDKVRGSNIGGGQPTEDEVQQRSPADSVAAETEDESQLRLMYDVHLPNSRFKKTAPGVPAFSLCITSGRPPRHSEVRRLQEENQGVPVKFASVECGHVTICSFDDIELECLP